MTPMASALAHVRSLLFLPINEPRFVRRATQSDADVIVYDLEDSVPEDRKGDARECLEKLPQTEKITFVRINGFDTAHFGLDLKGALRSNVQGLVLPKLESVEQLHVVNWMWTHFRRTPPVIIACIETAPAILNLERAIGSVPLCTAVMAGAPQDGDVATSVGFRWTSKGRERQHIEAHVLLQARALGIHNVWAYPWLGLSQDETPRIIDNQRQWDLGYNARAAIHPSHVTDINQTFGTDESEQARADESDMLRELEIAMSEGRGAIRYRGRMVDIAHLNHALRAKVQLKRDDSGKHDR